LEYDKNSINVSWRTLCFTVKGFLKGHSERSEAKKIASRAQLEDIASEVGERRRYLEDKLAREGGLVAG
jgi:hypothetical protein